MKNRLLLVALCAASVMSAHAVTLVVDSSNQQGWVPDDVRPGGTIGITNSFPQSGSGSLETNLAYSSAKAGYANYWSPSGTNQFGTTTKLGNLNSLSFDWYRSSESTVAAHFAPTLKLAWWNDNDNSNTLNTGDTSGTLVWERVYNDPGAAPTNAWQAENVFTDNFWQRTPGIGTNEDFDVTLAQWGSVAGYSSNGHPALNANTNILGLITDGGSGWGGASRMAVDNVQAEFNGNSVAYNFEARAVPEPSASLMTGLAALGLMTRRKRK